MKKIYFLIITLLLLFNKAQACSAGFRYVNSATPFQVVFTDTSKNAAKWLWKFGDGDTSSLKNPTHTYTSPGIYRVCLLIADSSNTCKDSICENVYAYGTCITSISHFYTATPLMVKFCDEPINTPNYPTHWLWNFGDSTFSTQRLPFHTYSSPGTYYVTLLVYDSSVSCIWFARDTIHLSPITSEFISVCDGKWTNPATWNKNAVPSPSDTVVIYNQVNLDTNVDMKYSPPPGLLYIEENASLCGHHGFTGVICVYGTLNVDSLTIAGNWPISSYTDFIPVNALYSITIAGDYTTQYLPLGGNNFNCSPPNPCVVGIQENTTNNITSIFPNPNNGEFTIEVNDGIDTSNNNTIEIYNMLGEIVFGTKLNSSTTRIDISNNASGIYLYRVISETGSLVSEGKFVIQK